MATGTFCGTGAWANAPKPGDPDGDVTLTVTPAFGGIDVEWTYPGVNPQAVAFVRLYRSTNLVDPDPMLHRIVTGSFFYDKTTTATPIEYAYWIELVSINGTVGDRIGPATGIARPPIAAVMEALTGQIEDSLLGQTLKAEIERISSNKLAVDQALLLQAATDDSLAAAFTELQAFSDNTRARVEEEAVARATANSAFVAQVNTLAVTLDNNISAAVQTEALARAAADEAVATQITSVESQLGDDLAQVQTGLETEIAAVNGDVRKIGALYTAKVGVNGLVGGFGVYNDGKTVEAAFDVDRFSIGKSGGGRIRPFIVDGEEVFINQAVIQSLTVDRLRTADGSVAFQNGRLSADLIDAQNLDVRSSARFSGDVFSDNFVTGKAGWALLQSGYVELNEAMIRGNLEVQSITVNGQSPFGALSISATGFTRGNIGDQTVHNVMDATKSIGEMPAGSRLSLRVFPRVNYSITGSMGGTRTRAGSGDSGAFYSTYNGTIKWHVKVRTRVWVDGVEILNDYRTITSGSRSGGPLQEHGPAPTISIQGAHPYANSGIGKDFRYGAYRSTSKIRVRIDVENYLDDYAANGNNVTQGDGNNITSGDILRLG